MTCPLSSVSNSTALWTQNREPCAGWHASVDCGVCHYRPSEALSVIAPKWERRAFRGDLSDQDFRAPAAFARQSADVEDTCMHVIAGRTSRTSSSWSITTMVKMTKTLDQSAYVAKDWAWHVEVAADGAKAPLATHEISVITSPYR
jgi:hypothetical protein